MIFWVECPFNVYANIHYLPYQGLGKDLPKSRCKIRADLSITQFSIWLKHRYAVKFLFFDSDSAHFLYFRLDSAPSAQSYL